LRDFFATYSIGGCRAVNENRADVPFGYVPSKSGSHSPFWFGTTEESESFEDIGVEKVN
jgi:hypothetical protein